MSTTKMIYQDFINKHSFITSGQDYIYITAINKNEERGDINTTNQIFSRNTLPCASIILCNKSIVEDIIQNCLLIQNDYLIFEDNELSTHIAKKVLEKVAQFEHANLKIVINATMIKKEILLIFLFAFRNVMPAYKLEIIYITPNEYGKYLISDYRTPHNMSFAPGIHHIGLPTMLLLMSGYERDGEIGLLRYYQPTVFLSGYADPPTEGKFKHRNEETFKQVIQLFADDEGITINEFTFTGNDPFECCNDIVLYLSNNGFNPENYNIHIAPMNNKLTSIGAYLVHERFPQIQIVDIIGSKQIVESISSGKASVYITEL